MNILQVRNSLREAILLQRNIAINRINDREPNKTLSLPGHLIPKRSGAGKDRREDSQMYRIFPNTGLAGTSRGSESPVPGIRKNPVAFTERHQESL